MGEAAAVRAAQAIPRIFSQNLFYFSLKSIEEL